VTKLRMGKSTIKNDPFATVIPLPLEDEPPQAIETEDAPIVVTPTPIVTPDFTEPPRRSVNTDRPRREVVKPVVKTGKQKLTVHLDSELAERVKNAAWWNPKLTIAGIAEQGIRHAIEKHEREHGGPYPPRDGELLGGRPIK
jgi:post-segregation antitoxin (ccd killing protein)